MEASTGRIIDKTTASVHQAINEGWVRSLDRALELTQIIEDSLYDSQMMRIRRNNVEVFSDRVDLTDPRVDRAMKGTATPEDLLAVLEHYPLLGSLEIAKLSHPLDAAATEAMDQVVIGAASKYFDTLDRSPAYYKTKSLVPDIPAATVLQKKRIALRETPYGTLRLVRRKAFLVRGDDEADALDPYMDRKVRNAARHAEDLYPKIDGYSRDGAPEQKWLQPLSTSYYAFYDRSMLIANE